MSARAYAVSTTAMLFFAAVVANTALAEGILVVPGEDEEAEEQILVEPRDDEDGSDDQVAPAPGVPVYPRSAPIVEEGMRVPESRQEELERPSEGQREMGEGDERQQDLELPDGPGIKY